MGNILFVLSIVAMLLFGAALRSRPKLRLRSRQHRRLPSRQLLRQCK